MTSSLTVSVYEAYGTALVADPAGDLLRAEVRSFETFYPGGLYGPCEIFIPRDVTAAWPFQVGQRLVIREGLQIVWEGAIAAIGYEVGDGAEQGRLIKGVGYWGWLLGARGVNKPWADIRLTDDVWVWQTGSNGAEKCTLDRVNRLRFTPKGVAWTTNQVASVRYTAPTGQTIKRLTFTYTLAEGAQAWRLALNNDTTLADEWAVTASGSAAVDLTLATPASGVLLYIHSQANQTPTEDGTYYAQVTSMTVYTETGAINGQEIAKDVRGLLSSELNGDETRIGALTLSLVPFVTQGYEMFADLLARAASFGDSSFNAWAAYLDHSETAQTLDGEPVLVLEQQPALTDYDYAVRVDDHNVVPPLRLEKDGAGVFNWIVVKYRDELNNRDVILTPDNDANLKDTASLAEPHGQREYVLSAYLTTATAAKNLARRFLAEKKDPRFYVAAPITVVGSIRGKQGQSVPASQIRAGQRVKIENFLTDEVGVSGAGLTFLITHTRYDDENETCAISCGVPDDLAVILAQLQAFPDQVVVG